MSAAPHRGSCLCGEITYEVRGPLRNVIACHCTQCRKQTGHYMAATRANRKDLEVAEAGRLRWYRSSAQAERGFCGNCGSILFWRVDGGTDTSITAGTLDGPTGLVIEGHIFCADKGDYYTIPADGYRRDKGIPGA
jgi:hypothetical protein